MSWKLWSETECRMLWFPLASKDLKGNMIWVCNGGWGFGREERLMVCLQVEVLREPFTAVYGLSQNVSELRAAALLAQSPQTCLFLVCACSCLAMQLVLPAVQDLILCLQFRSAVGVHTDGGTCGWGIRKERGVPRRGDPSLPFSVIPATLTFLQVFQNAG